jgi:hypothetical protein
LRHTGNLLTLRRYAKVVQLALPNDNLTKDANDFLCKILLSLQRNYDVSLPHNKIPDLLSALAKKMAIPAMPSGEEFKPEAAIVNYYGPSDMLGGHVDDMEADWSKPIVSISAFFFLEAKREMKFQQQCFCEVVISY